MAEGAREDGSVTFYFFDFDDNTMFLDTQVGLRDRRTGTEVLVSTHAFAQIRQFLGRPGEWEHHELYEGSYRFFRDKDPDAAQGDDTEYFVQDIRHAIIHKDEMLWQAPSWTMFVHACAAGRPLSIITARGHSDATIKAGVRALVDAGLLPREPNYLAIHAVSNPDSRQRILDGIADPQERAAVLEQPDPTSALKRHAIHQTVELALATYGPDKPHRFGMSDDDPGNIDLIVRAMAECKEKHPDKRFFAINTHTGRHVKLEVYPIHFAVTRETFEPGDVIA